MKKVTYFLSLAICSVFIFSSCEKCKDCTITTTTTFDDPLMSIMNTSFSDTQEFCGDELDEVDGKVDVGTSFNFDGFKYETKVVYDCK